MATPDASLGIIAEFDNDQFRNAVRFSMQMGLPTNPDDRPKFVRESEARTYWKDGVQLSSPPRMGREKEPLDPTIEVRTSPSVTLTCPLDPTRPDVTLDCVVEIERADPNELPVGKFHPTKAVVTFLDVDYAKIQGVRRMTYNGDKYIYGYEPEVNGLFEVSVRTIVWYCPDDS